MDGPSPALLFVVGGEEDDTVVVVTDAEDGWGGLMGRIDADMILSRGVFSSGRAREPSPRLSYCSALRVKAALSTKSLGGRESCCHHFLMIYDRGKLVSVYVSPRVAS